jgi:hypothetical protein
MMKKHKEMLSFDAVFKYVAFKTVTPSTQSVGNFFCLMTNAQGYTAYTPEQASLSQ